MTNLRGSKPQPSFWERAVEWAQSLLDTDEAEPDDDDSPVVRHKLPERANVTVGPRVRQVDETGCGVGVAAMLSRQPYSVVKAFMFPKPRRSYGTHYKDVWRALEHFGVGHETQTRKFDGWKSIPSHALVLIRWKGMPVGSAFHWVIYQHRPNGRGRVIDTGSWGNTLTDIDLTTCTGVSYSLVTPRTREQGPLKVGEAGPVPPEPPKPRPAVKPRAAEKHEPATLRLLALGKTPVASIRENAQALEAIAEVTGLRRGAVLRRAKSANGKTHVRVVFEDRWPSRLEVLGREPGAELAKDVVLVTELARLLGAKAGDLVGDLQAKRGRTAREALDARWPRADQLTREDILGMTVQQARSSGESSALAKGLGIEPSRFARRLKGAHGAMLLARAFADLLPEVPQVAAAGLLFGRYKVMGPTLRGGFGKVREAWDHKTSPKLHVVLKWPHPETHMIEALEGEYERAKDLRHPGLAGYIELLRDPDGKPVLVIEHGGVSLSEHLEKEKRKRLSVEEALTLFRKLAVALDYLQEEGVAHLDLHPGNILVDSEGQPRITDFGISRRFTGAVGKTRATSLATGYSPWFGPPELRGGDARRSSDQYSLARVFLACVFGGVEAADAAIHADDLLASLSEEQVAAYERATMQSSAKRFPTCMAFVEALGDGA